MNQGSTRFLRHVLGIPMPELLLKRSAIIRLTLFLRVWATLGSQVKVCGNLLEACPLTCSRFAFGRHVREGHSRYPAPLPVSVKTPNVAASVLAWSDRLERQLVHWES